MYGSRLHSKYGFATILDELVEHCLGIVVFTVSQSGKASHTNHIAVTTHHRDSLQQVFTLITIHNDTTLRLQFPCTGIDIKHDNVHA